MDYQERLASQRDLEAIERFGRPAYVWETVFARQFEENPGNSSVQAKAIEYYEKELLDPDLVAVEGGIYDDRARRRRS